jgi:hypothetical protein
MNKKGVMLFLLASLLVIISFSFVSSICPDKLFAYYKFNENHGTKVIDYINSRNGTVNGNTNPSWVPGIKDSSLRLNDSTYLSLPDRFNQITNGAIEIWIKPYRMTSQTIFDASTNSRYFFLDINQSKDLRFYFDDSSSNNHRHQAIYNLGNLPNNTWYHVAVVWKRATNSAQLFLNGNRVAIDKDRADANIPNLNNLYLGKTRSNSGTLWAFDGLIDEFIIYNRTLEPAEILSHYSQGIECFEPAPMPPSCQIVNQTFLNAYGSRCGQDGYNKTADFTNDGKIDALDISPWNGNVYNATWCLAQINKQNDPCYIPVVQKNCSSKNQTILRLTNFSNGLGEIWNGSNGLYEICYNEIFGLQYTGVNPHNCNGKNMVLKLNSTINAKAEIKENLNYNVNICYGNLSCTNRTGSCLSEEKLIVSLSSLTNAVIGNSSGNVNICCLAHPAYVPPVGTSPPNAVIIGPKHKSIYFINDNINLIENSTDDSGIMSVNWSLGDGRSYSCSYSAVKNSNCNLIANYSTGGQRNIVLSVKDSDGNVSEARIGILIIGSSYVFADIKEPLWNSIKNNRNVNFDAGASFAVNYNSSRAVECLAGDCPNQTANGTMIYYWNQKNFNDLSFKWNFAGISSIVNGNEKTSYNFSSDGYKLAGLNVSLNSISSATNVGFLISSEVLQGCINGNWYERGVLKNTKQDAGYCNRIPNGCCPYGYSCQNEENFEGEVCVLNSIPNWCDNITTCSNYKTSDSCARDECLAAEYSAELQENVNCGLNAYNCSCKWSSGNCTANYKYKDNSGLLTGLCIKSFVNGECINGIMTISWTATASIPSLLCESGGEETYECGQAVAKMPFFSFFSFMITAFLLIVFYFLKNEE